MRNIIIFKVINTLYYTKEAAVEESTDCNRDCGTQVKSGVIDEVRRGILLLFPRSAIDRIHIYAGPFVRAYSPLVSFIYTRTRDVFGLTRSIDRVH